MNNPKISNKLELKDLVLIGVYAVIYIVIMFAVGMMGLVPILFLIYPTVAAIICGPLVLLFMAKVPKPLSLVVIMLLGGHTYVVIVVAAIIVVIAELIRKLGNYRSLKYNMLSYAVFAMWIGGSLSQMVLAREKYLQMCKMMGDNYGQALAKLITYPNLALVFLGAFVGGLIGALLGKKILKKHFVRAGIV